MWTSFFLLQPIRKVVEVWIFHVGSLGESIRGHRGDFGYLAPGPSNEGGGGWSDPGEKEIAIFFPEILIFFSMGFLSLVSLPSRKRFINAYLLLKVGFYIFLSEQV